MQYGLRYWASVYPDRPVVSVHDTRLTYAELESRVNQLARVVDNYGLSRGDHVAALLPNNPFTIVMAWAA